MQGLGLILFSELNTKLFDLAISVEAANTLACLVITSRAPCLPP